MPTSATEISAKQVTELPLNLRNVFNFVQLNSSVNNNSQRQILQSGGEQGTADQDVSFFNFGGGFFGTTHSCWMAPGIPSAVGAASFTFPSPDNVQELGANRTRLPLNMVEHRERH